MFIIFFLQKLNLQLYDFVFMVLKANI